MNLCEILKNSPDEIFYNPLLGNVTVTPASDGNLIHIHQGGFTVDIAPDGTDNDGNLALYPSREERDWEQYKAKIQQTSDTQHLSFKLGDKVKVKSSGQIGFIGQPLVTDTGYRVYGFGDGGWDNEYTADELELIESFTYTINDNVICTDLYDKEHYKHKGKIIYIDATRTVGVQYEVNSEENIDNQENDNSDNVVYYSYNKNNIRFKKILSCKSKQITNETLDLCDILKGHINETFFSLTYGNIQLVLIKKDTHKYYPLEFISETHKSFNVMSNGKMDINSCFVDIWPSKELYTQYSDNPEKAWNSWLASMPKYSLEILMTVTEYQGNNEYNKHTSTILKDCNSVDEVNIYKTRIINVFQ